MKVTIIFTVRDIKNKQYYIQNIGVSDVNEEIKRRGLYCYIPKNINNDELSILLQNIVDDNTKIESVIDLDNSYNRDQKQINIIKNTIRNHPKFEGWIEVEHTTNNITFDMTKLKRLIQTRDYLTELEDKNKRLEVSIKKLQQECANNLIKLKEGENELQSKISDLTNNIIKLKQEEYQLQCELDKKHNYVYSEILALEEKLKREKVMYDKRREQYITKNTDESNNNELISDIGKLKYQVFKLNSDLSMWKDFAHDYGLDKAGGIMLLRNVLGDKSEFINKYINK